MPERRTDKARKFRGSRTQHLGSGSQHTVVVWFAARPSNMTVYLRDGSAATLRQKVKINPASSPNDWRRPIQSQSRCTDTGPTSPSPTPPTPGVWQSSHWSNNNNNDNNRIQRRYSRCFYNLLTAPRTVSNTHAQVVRAQSRANHVQHIERLSRASVMLRATWYAGTAQLLSLELYFIG